MATNRLEGRNGSIWRAYLLGTTQEELGERHGISQERVSAIIAAVRASIPETDLAKAKQEHLDVMRTLAQVAADIMESPLPPAYSNGRPIIDENGEYVRDAGPRMQALDRLVKINERVAKVLGLDAPIQADVRVSELENQASEEAARAAMIRMLDQSTDE